MGLTAHRPAWAERLPRYVTAQLLDVDAGTEETHAVVRRRRGVVVVTLLLGTSLLALSLAIVRPGDPAFYPSSLALAAVWIVGGVASGPLRLGRIHRGRGLRRPIASSFVLGLLVAGAFVLGALLTREIAVLRHIADRVLSHARDGSTPLVLFVALVNGVGEEVFFRGAVYASIRRRPVLVTTLIYTAVTVATWNVMLVFSAATLGTVLALQRRASGGILGSVITHLTWSAVLVLALPPLFAI